MVRSSFRLAEAIHEESGSPSTPGCPLVLSAAVDDALMASFLAACCSRRAVGMVREHHRGQRRSGRVPRRCPHRAGVAGRRVGDRLGDEDVRIAGHHRATSAGSAGPGGPRADARRTPSLRSRDACQVPRPNAVTRAGGHIGHASSRIDWMVCSSWSPGYSAEAGLVGPGDQQVRLDHGDVAAPRGWVAPEPTRLVPRPVFGSARSDSRQKLSAYGTNAAMMSSSSSRLAASSRTTASWTVEHRQISVTACAFAAHSPRRGGLRAAPPQHDEHRDRGTATRRRGRQLARSRGYQQQLQPGLPFLHSEVSPLAAPSRAAGAPAGAEERLGEGRGGPPRAPARGC